MSSLNLQNVEDEEEQLRRPKNNNREYTERFQWLKSALDFFYTHTNMNTKINDKHTMFLLNSHEARDPPSPSPTFAGSRNTRAKHKLWKSDSLLPLVARHIVFEEGGRQGGIWMADTPGCMQSMQSYVLTYPGLKRQQQL